MGDVLARPWRSFLQSRFYRLVDVWRTEAVAGLTPIIARTPSAGRFSADGTRLLVGMTGEWERHERVKLFSIDGTEIAGYATRPEEGGVFGVGFSADEAFVVAALHRKLIRWTVDGERVGEYALPRDAMARAISADGATGIVSHPYGRDPAIELVDLVAMRTIAQVPGPLGHEQVALARDARSVFASDEHAVHCIPFDAGGPRWRVPTRGGTRRLVVSDDGAFVVACHAPLAHPGNEVVVHRVEDGEVVRRFPSTIVNGASLLLDGRLLVWPQGGGAGEIFDLTSDLPSGRSAHWVADVLCVSRDGGTLARGTFQHELALVHDARDGTPRVGPPRYASVRALAVSPDGSRVAALGARQSYDLHDAGTGAAIATGPASEFPAAWSTDGSYLAEAERIRGLVPPAVPDFARLVVSPSGRRGLFGNGLGENYLIDLEARTVTLHLPSKRSTPRYASVFRMLDDTSAVFAPPGKLVALDLETDTPRWEIPLQPQGLLVDAARARMIVLTSEGMRVLSTASGEELDRMDIHSASDSLGAVALGPDGRLYLGSALGRIYVFGPAG